MNQNIWDIGKFRVVTTKKAKASTANVSISPSALRFNLSAAAELEYPPYVQILIHEDGSKMAVLAYSEDDKTSTEFYKKVFSKKKQQYIDPSSVLIHDRAIANFIRKQMGWRNGAMKCNAMRFQDQAGALFFDFSMAEPSKSCCGQRKTRDFSIDAYPMFADAVSSMRPVVFALPGKATTSSDETIELEPVNFAVQ